MSIEVRVDGVPVVAQESDTVASLLVREGHVAWRRTRFGDRPRGLFCGMGACQDCLVMVDGTSGVRACLTPVRAGMDVATSEAGRG